MANRFWRGGSGTWDASTTTNWSTTSGGSGGASAPTSSDAAIFDANSGTGTCTLSGSPSCASLDASASTILTFTGTGTLTCAGNFTLKTGLTVSGWTGTVTLTGTGSQTTTFGASNTMAFSLTINSVGGTYTMQDNFATGATKTLGVTQGTFNANGNAVTVGLLTSTVANTRAITFGSGQWTLTGNNGVIFFMSSTAGLTISAPTLAVICNYAGSTGTRTFSSTASAPFVSFNVTAGSDIVSFAGNYQSISLTGFSGSVAVNGFTVNGSLTCPNTATWTAGGTALTIASSGSVNIDTNGVLIDRPITFSGTGTYTLLSDLQCGSTRTMTHSSGTLDANGHNVKTGVFSSGGSTTRAVKMGTGTWELTSTAATTIWSMNTTGITLNPSSSTIKISGSTTNIRTFGGGGNTYDNIWITNATSGGEVDFTGSNTFNDFKQQDATPQTIKFTAGTTTTVSTWSAFGSVTGNLTIDSITASTHNIVRVLPPVSGNIFVCLDYMTIGHSTATSVFYAGLHSTNNGNNSGWTFWSCPNTGGFFSLMAG